MAERIFISYRREDSRGYAGRLQGDLSRRYTNEAVFRDIEIPPGVDFAEHIYGLIELGRYLDAALRGTSAMPPSVAPPPPTPTPTPAPPDHTGLAVAAAAAA